MNDEGIPTPRNLAGGRNQPGSGTLPGQKRSMDGVVTPNKDSNREELLEHVQSATQSQQFKTMDDSKTALEESVPEVSLKKNL